MICLYKKYQNYANMEFTMKKNKFGLCYLRFTSSVCSKLTTVSTTSTFISIDYENSSIIGIEFIGGISSESVTLNIENSENTCRLYFLENVSQSVKDEFDVENELSWSNDSVSVYLLRNTISYIEIANSFLPKNFNFKDLEIINSC